jgi:hypothetical protein
VKAEFEKGGFWRMIAFPFRWIKNKLESTQVACKAQPFTNLDVLFESPSLRASPSGAG